MTVLLSHLVTFLAGGLYALTYPSRLGEGWLPLLFIALGLFLWKLEGTHRLRDALAHVLTYNVGLNLVGFYWIPHTLREFGQLPYVLSVLIGLLFSLILQPHWYIYALWRKWRPEFTWNSGTGTLLAAFLMTFLERYVPQQFPIYAGSPWLHLAPYLGLAPYAGVAAFSFMTYWTCLETITQLRLKKFRPPVWVALMVFVVVNALLRLPSAPSSEAINVRVVQANIGNFLKVASEQGDLSSFGSINQKYENLSTADNGFRPDLIVWPETAYPDSFYGRGAELPVIFRDVMSRTGAEMLIGGYDHDLEKARDDFYESVYNSSLLLSQNKIKYSYHKNILIPFGETLPFGPLNEKIVSLVPAVSLFARGDGTEIMRTRNGIKFVTPICYEILESGYMRFLLGKTDGARFIVNHTNDSWYGNTSEPYQHLFLSKWRALEFQLPVIRSTNTGVSSVILPDGSESRRLGVGESGVLDVTVPLGSGKETFYLEHGVLPVLGLFIFLLAIQWALDRFTSAKN